MSKVKEQMMIDEAQEFELELSYQEYLQDNYTEPSSIEVMDMAREILRANTFTKLFWYVNATNNIDYNPIITTGA